MRHPSPHVDIEAIPLKLLAATIAAVLLFGLIQSFRLAVVRWLPARRLRLVRERGAQGEIRAEALLRRLGYDIVARQAGLTYGASLDGQPLSVDLRADFLVERANLRFVAEVKTGRLAPRLETRPPAASSSNTALPSTQLACCSSASTPAASTPSSSRFPSRVPPPAPASRR